MKGLWRGADGSLRQSECRAKPENRGKGKCKHFAHVGDARAAKQYIALEETRAALHDVDPGGFDEQRLEDMQKHLIEGGDAYAPADFNAIMERTSLDMGGSGNVLKKAKTGIDHRIQDALLAINGVKDVLRGVYKKRRHFNFPLSERASKLYPMAVIRRGPKARAFADNMDSARESYFRSMESAPLSTRLYMHARSLKDVQADMEILKAEARRRESAGDSMMADTAYVDTQRRRALVITRVTGVDAEKIEAAGIGDQIPKTTETSYYVKDVRKLLDEYEVDDADREKVLVATGGGDLSIDLRKSEKAMKEAGTLDDDGVAVYGVDGSEHRVGSLGQRVTEDSASAMSSAELRAALLATSETEARIGEAHGRDLDALGGQAANDAQDDGIVIKVSSARTGVANDALEGMAARGIIPRERIEAIAKHKVTYKKEDLMDARIHDKDGHALSPLNFLKPSSSRVTIRAYDAKHAPSFSRKPADDAQQAAQVA